MDKQPHRAWRSRTVAFSILIVLLGVRAAAELGMMSESGSDPQMPIWIMLLLVKLALWSGGAVLIWRLVAVPRNRWVPRVGLTLLVAWAAAILYASFEYRSATRALADASNPYTSAERLRELVRFSGIQAGYELDNRLASNMNTPADALRMLYDRGNLGTRMCLARNKNFTKPVP